MGYQPQPGGQPVIVVQNKKSPQLAIVLALFFGPLGMFYATTKGALIMLVIDLVLIPLTVFTLGIGGISYLITWAIGIGWASSAAKSYNNRLLVASAAVQPQLQQPGSVPTPYQGQSGPYQQPGSMPNPYQGQSGPYQQPGPAPTSFQQPQ